MCAPRVNETKVTCRKTFADNRFAIGSKKE